MLILNVRKSMKTKANGIKIVATSKFRLNNIEMSNLLGGISDSSVDLPSTPLDPMSGCGCCLCTPRTSASGASNYTATASGGK